MKRKISKQVGLKEIEKRNLKLCADTEVISTYRDKQEKGIIEKGHDFTRDVYIQRELINKKNYYYMCM